MKLIITYCVLFAFVLYAMQGCTIQQFPAQESIIGTWCGIDEDGVEASIVFRNDGSADLIFDGVSLSEMKDPVKGILKYKLDTSKTPYCLSVIAKYSNGKEKTIYGLVEIISEDQIKMGLKFDGRIPKSWESMRLEKNVIILERVSSL